MTTGGRSDTQTRSVPGLLALAAAAGFALTLRAPLSSLAVALPDAQRELGMSPLTASLLTSLPVLCFALVGLTLGPALGRIDLRRTTLAALLVISVGLLLRAVTDHTAVFLTGSVLGFVAIAVGNILVPAAARALAPHRASLLSSILAASIIGGSTLGAALTGWIDHLAGWRVALASIAGLSLAAILLWIPVRVPSSSSRPEATARASKPSPLRLRQLLPIPPVWLLTLCFGLVTAQAYAQLGWYPAILIDAGLNSTAAATQLALLTAVGIPTMLALPVLTRVLGPRTVIICFASATTAGWLGVLLSPTAAPWAWSTLIGFGAGSFAWTLTMIVNHTDTPQTTVVLASLVQGVGFLLAAAGPFGVGLLHDRTGSWNPALWLLVATGAGIGIAGAGLTRRWTVESLIARHTKHDR